MNSDFRCGYVLIVGKPNVGKSTLMNALLGQKLSITSPKPQTTRRTIKGIYNDNTSQIIFLDTPGFLNPRYELQKHMLKQLTDAFKDADVVLFITDASDYPTDYDNELLKLVSAIHRPHIALINKSDLTPKSSEVQIRDSLSACFDKILFVSAKSGTNLDLILPALLSYLPYNPPYYDSEQLSDLPMRFFAEEVIREAIFRQYAQEIPYCSAVLIDKYDEQPTKTIIHSTIWLERDSQKPILIGKNGIGLQRIREYSEAQLTIFNGITTEIHLWVKIKKNWRKSLPLLRELGFRN
jgi:GTP-binding protein Era